MDHGSLDELLGEPGEYIGARRVRRPRPAAGVLALEWWDGTAWICAGEAADNDGVRALMRTYEIGCGGYFGCCL